jgi:DNA-binding cell septation regulator SpoVG
MAMLSRKMSSGVHKDSAHPIMQEFRTVLHDKNRAEYNAGRIEGTETGEG